MTRHTFHTDDTTLAARDGQAVTLLGPLDEAQFDRSEVGAMYRIAFADGTEASAFADELTPHPGVRTMKPEEVIALPLSVDAMDATVVYDDNRHWFADANANGDDAPAAALVAMCNAYPLALRLAEVAEALLYSAAANGNHVSQARLDTLRADLAAFLAHRNTEARNV